MCGSIVDEGDNAPLPITAARLLLPSYRLRFFRPAGATLRLVYGRDDLQRAAVRSRAPGAARDGRRGARGHAAAGGRDAPPRASFISPRAFWVVLGGAVLVLLALIVRLIAARRRSETWFRRAAYHGVTRLH